MLRIDLAAISVKLMTFLVPSGSDRRRAPEFFRYPGQDVLNEIKLDSKNAVEPKLLQGTNRAVD